jgi:tetratricopeptide (TPR) repeat protein
LIALSVVAVCVGSAWASWVYLRPLPDLSHAAALAQGHFFDEADALVQSYLQRVPSSIEARMLAAQIVLDRPTPPVPEGQPQDPAPALAALDYLRSIKPRTPYLAALAELYRGKAEYRLGHLDSAESAWTVALEHDPRIPEAGWHLLEVYYLQGRPQEARELALRLHAIEPDRRDQVQYLLELLRQDVQPPAPASIVRLFQPIVDHDPGAVRGRITLAIALGRTSSVDQGLEVLKPLLEKSPGDPDAWEAWLTVLEEGGEIDRLIAAVDQIPSALAGSPRFARFVARAAQEKGNWKEAAEGYRVAIQFAPADQSFHYRLIRALRSNGDKNEANRLDKPYTAYLAAKKEAQSLYDDANPIKSLGQRPAPLLFQKIADLRERMGLREEALAWHRLVLRDDKTNALSLAKVKELRDSEGSAPPEKSR